jgi:hypothetical protein
LTFAIFANGYVGANAEHSAGDATVRFDLFYLCLAVKLAFKGHHWDKTKIDHKKMLYFRWTSNCVHQA